MLGSEKAGSDRGGRRSIIIHPDFKRSYGDLPDREDSGQRSEGWGSGCSDGRTRRRQDLPDAGNRQLASAFPDGYVVTSPTFTLINEYPGREAALYHLDVYRLTGSADLRRNGISRIPHERRCDGH